MEIKIKYGNGYVEADWTIEDGVMVVSPKDVFNPKDGDICKSPSCIYIFKGVRPSSCNNSKLAIVYHCCLSGDSLIVREDVGVGYISSNQRYATEKEKQRLFDKLAEEGYEFDFEKKELVKLKWKPKINEAFYYPSYLGGGSYGASLAGYRVQSSLDNDKDIQKGWCFKTKEECQAFCDKLNQAINEVKP